MARLAEQTPNGITKTCPLCGKQFGCAQGQPGCWCETVVLRRETLTEIRAAADGCMCPACLSAFAKRERARRDPIEADGPAEDRGAANWAKALPHPAVRARACTAVWALIALAFPAAALPLGLSA